MIRLSKHMFSRPTSLMLAGCLAGGLVTLVPVGSASAQCQYEVTVIKGPICGDFGYPPTQVTGINESGVMAGTYLACSLGPDVPFTWTPESGVVPIDLPSGDGGPATDINDAGQVTGWFNPQGSFAGLGFLHDNTGLTIIYPPAGTFLHAHGLNNQAQIVHTSFHIGDEYGC